MRKKKKQQLSILKPKNCTGAEKSRSWRYVQRIKSQSVSYLWDTPSVVAEELWAEMVRRRQRDLRDPTTQTRHLSSISIQKCQDAVWKRHTLTCWPLNSVMVSVFTWLFPGLFCSCIVLCLVVTFYFLLTVFPVLSSCCSPPIWISTWHLSHTSLVSLVCIVVPSLFVDSSVSVHTFLMCSLCSQFAPCYFSSSPSVLYLSSVFLLGHSFLLLLAFLDFGFWTLLDISSLKLTVF